MNKSLLFVSIIVSQVTYSAEFLSKQDLVKVLSACCSHNYLVFTAQDLNKHGQNPDTCFGDIYACSNVKIPAWSMSPSWECHGQEISLVFGMPDDYKPSCPLEVTFYLVAEKHHGSCGNKANIRIQADHKCTHQEICCSFSSINSTGNFVVEEPSHHKCLETIIITATLKCAGIAPHDWVLFALDRIAPTHCAQEYDKKIYLTGVVIKYGIK